LRCRRLLPVPFEDFSSDGAVADKMVAKRHPVRTELGFKALDYRYGVVNYDVNLTENVIAIVKTGMFLFTFSGFLFYFLIYFQHV
jgi:hypothetical protein